MVTRLRAVSFLQITEAKFPEVIIQHAMNAAREGLANPSTRIWVHDDMLLIKCVGEPDAE